MNVSAFKDTLEQLADTNSRNKKKEIVRGVSHSPAAISFLSGSEFDDAGLGKKTVLSVANTVYDDLDGKPTVSEDLDETEEDVLNLRARHGQKELSELRVDMQTVADLSGNEMEQKLREMFIYYDYPSVVSHACLDDWPTGVGDSTIASALDLEDSLPFYDSVVDAAEVSGEPLTEPAVGTAFSPMLAKSESSLPDDLSGYVGQPKLDGYRLLVHVTQGDVRAFTRRRNEVTESLPELNEIEWCFDGREDFILDCEVIAETGNYSDTSERIGRNAENVEREVEMEFAVFDVLTYNCRSIYELPYRERYGWTVSIADLVQDKRVYALPIYADIEKAREASSNYEGLIWKKLDAPYQFDKRSKAWVKQKHQAETVDLVAAKFVEGEGRLDGTLGKVKLSTADGHSVGYTGSGFSDAERDEVWANQDEYHGQTLEVEAEAFDEALRFPIFQRWRSDDGEPDSLERVKSVLPET